MLQPTVWLGTGAAVAERILALEAGQTRFETESFGACHPRRSGWLLVPQIALTLLAGRCG